MDGNQNISRMRNARRMKREERMMCVDRCIVSAGEISGMCGRNGRRGIITDLFLLLLEVYGKE